MLALQVDAEAYGEALAAGLFHDANVRALYLRARTATAAAGRWLRLRLLIAPSAAPLAALRWELLHDPARPGTPVATSEKTLFSRFLHSRDWRGVEPRAQRRQRSRRIWRSSN